MTNAANRIEPFPGPYRVEGRSIKAISHGQYFTIGRADCTKFTPEGNEATARLFAASAELLDALQSLLNVEGAARLGAQSQSLAGLDVAYHFEKARTALKKAGV